MQSFIQPKSKVLTAILEGRIFEKGVFYMKMKRKTVRNISICIWLFLMIFSAVLFAFGETKSSPAVYMFVWAACLWKALSAVG